MKRHGRLFQQRGLSLIELLLAVVILSLSDRHKPVFVPIRDSACFAGEPNVLYPEIRSS